MSSKHELYPSVSATSKHTIHTTTASGKELDLRAEFHRTLYAAADAAAKGRTGLFRRMRRGSDGYPIRCTCRDEVTDEPSRDYYCSDCLGHGYLFDETWIVYNRNDDAPRRWGYYLFYVEYSVEPTSKDFIIEVERDVDGNPVVPTVREHYYRIDEAEDFRADDGRVEYWRLKASLVDRWSLWYGEVQQRT